MRTVYLSHFLNEKTPLYGGDKLISIKNRTRISKGDSSNTCLLKLPNHSGTHIDFPYHFSENGNTLNDISPSFWSFEKVHVIPLSVEIDSIIDCELVQISNIPEDVELLLLHTGFGHYRNEDIYWEKNPGLAPDLAGMLRKRCPDLKAIGVDFISVSSYQNRSLGREAHREFLIENDILIIEDMKLDELQNISIKSITALPLLVDGVDGTPITVIASYE